MTKTIADQRESLSIVMPVYREGEHIGVVLDAVSESLAGLDISYELLLIDDGSPDDTWDVLEELAARFPRLRAVRLSRNFGKELALCAGLEMARGDAVIVMDGDGQHPPAILPEMIRIWRATDVDIVDGQKVQRGKETLLSKTGARLFYYLWNKLSGFELTGASDYKLLSRRAVNAYLQMKERNVFFRGMTAWLGFRRASVPFEVAGRIGGNTGWSVIRLLRLALTGITAFSALPLQVITIAGGLFMLFAIVFGIQTLIVLMIGHAVSGFATVIFLLLIIGGLVMISLGIIGEYLGRIYDEVKGRPRYLIGRVLESAEPLSEL
jgi:glycosyltransferase involved in cell wall biosynthesis